jgi:hypothetical protein
MAKKRRKRAKEEKYAFKFPEFDEVEYLKKEIKETKVAIVNILYAVLIAFISLGIMVLFRDVMLAFLIGLLALITLKYTYRFVNIDTTIFDRKKWAANIAMFFFTWLAVWVLISNPPISDFAKPTVEIIEIKEDDKWVPIDKFQPTVPTVFSVRAKITDNSGLDIKSLRLKVLRDTVEITDEKLVAIAENYYGLKNPVSIEESGYYKVLIYATDLHGNECIYEKDFFTKAS